MKTLHLFAGAGGGLLCDLILGHEPIVAVEWDAYCCRVLRERAAEGWFPNLRVHEGDVRLFDPSEYAGRVDCIHAGFPCTDISSAGNQAGVGEGTRSGLYREVLRIADVVRPRYLFLENVAAILKKEWLQTILQDLATIGYDARWTCLPASAAGAPHYRDRWWCLAERSHGNVGESKDGKQFSNAHVADADAERLQERSFFTGGKGKENVLPERKAFERDTWWSSEPNMDRMDDGMADRVDRIKALGNGQVPIQAALAWVMLGGPI